MFDALFFKLLDAAERIRREERGDSLVNWVVLAVGLAAAAAAVVAPSPSAIFFRLSTVGFRSPRSTPPTYVR
jgi:hypothetical protein